MSARPASLGWLLAPLLALTLPALATADKVWLRNGNFLEGEAVVLDSGDVAIRSAAGTLTVPASSVLRIERSQTVEEIVLERLERIDDPDADAYFALAMMARDGGAETLARRLLERAIAADPDHAEARAALGFERWEDRWVTERERRALEGEVFFRGEWVSSEMRDRILAEEAARRTLTEARRLELEIARLEAQAAAERRRQAEARSTGIPYWYVFAPSPWPVHPPDLVDPPWRPPEMPPDWRPPVRPTPPELEPTEPPPVNRSRFRPPGR